MKIKKRYTVKEWKKLYKIQDKLCKKYDVILIDYKTRREKVAEIFEKINLKNLNKGMITFNKIIQDFGGSMEQLTSEIDKTSKNNVKIWSDDQENEPKKSKDQINLDKIWGKRK
jgi:hypothetical protein